MSKVCWVRSAAWALVLGGAVARGQSAPGSLTDVLLEMSGRAAVVFAGQVTEIARHDDAGYVDVRFRVEEPVRGTSKLGVYVVREWAGRWAGQAPRYRVGQRLLMLLTARGPSGFSAPVNGSDGAIPLTRSVVGPVAGPGGVTPDAPLAGSGDSVDLRLLQARVARQTVGESQPTPVVIHAAGLSSADPGWAGPVAPIEVVPEGGLGVQPSLAALLALLRGNVGGTYAAR